MFLGQMLALLKHVQLCGHAHVCLCACVSSIFVSVRIGFLLCRPTFVPQLHTWVIYIFGSSVTIRGRMTQGVLPVFNVSFHLFVI